MGLAPSTICVFTTVPMIFSRWPCDTDTPSSMPNVAAKFAVSATVTSTPPLRTNSCKCSRPSQPRPGRMSSVESFAPEIRRFRASFSTAADCPNRSAALDDGCWVAESARGREENHVVFRAQISFMRRRLRADVIVRNLQIIERFAPPALGLRRLPGVQQRHASGAHGMRFHAGRGIERIHLQSPVPPRRVANRPHSTS